MDKKKMVFLVMILFLVACLLITYRLTTGVGWPKDYLIQLVLSSPSQRRENDSENLMTQYLRRWEALKIYKNNYAEKICELKDPGPCVNVTCNATFPPFQARLQDIFGTQYKVSDVHLDVLKSLGARVPPADLVFLTAASENHFEESQGVIKDLHEKVFPWLDSSTNFTYTFIYYDLGLENRSATMMTSPDIAVKSPHGKASCFIQNRKGHTTIKHCRCHVLAFPFRSLETLFGRLNTYKWKPLLVKAHIERSKILIYMDASVRFVTGDIQALIQRAMADGFAIFRDGFMLPAHVMPSMLEYFRVEPCLLGPYYETEANFFMVKNELLMNKVLVDPWTSCAFAPRCIYPGDNWLSLLPCAVKNGGYSRCHRFDQAALGVLLVKLFDWKSTQLVERSGNIQIHRDNKVKYFPEH